MFFPKGGIWHKMGGYFSKTVYIAKLNGLCERERVNCVVPRARYNYKGVIPWNDNKTAEIHGESKSKGSECVRPQVSYFIKGGVKFSSF